MINIDELNDEKYNLQAWFKWYDTQTIQYGRDIRLNGHSDIDIATLDQTAQTNAARIKEIDGILIEYYASKG